MITNLRRPLALDETRCVQVENVARRVRDRVRNLKHDDIVRADSESESQSQREVRGTEYLECRSYAASTSSMTELTGKRL